MRPGETVLVLLDSNHTEAHVRDELDAYAPLVTPGSYIVAIRKSTGELEMRPSKETLLEEGDVVVGLGAPEEIARLEKLFEPREAVV